MKKIIAIILVLVLSASVVTVFLLNNKNEAESFTALIEAVKYTANYNGAYTTEKNTEVIYLYGGDEDIESYTETVSYDKEKSLGFYKRVEGDKSRALKIFDDEGVYYCLLEETENGLKDRALYSYEDFYRSFGEQILLDGGELGIGTILGYHLKGLHLASSFEELKDAYNTVLNAENLFDTGDSYYDGATLSSALSFEANGDEASLTIVVTLSSLDETTLKTTATVTARGGAVTELSASFEELDDDGDKYVVNILYTFTYGFDTAAYSAIENLQPQGATVISDCIVSCYGDYGYIGKVFVTDNITHNDEWVSLSSLDGLAERLHGHLQHEYGNAAVINGVYLDKNKTTLITNDNFDVVDLMNIDKIYVDLDIDTDYAVVRYKATYTDQMSKKYKIVLGDNWLNTEENSSTMCTVYAISVTPSHEIYTEDYLTRGDDYTVKVNGSETSEETVNFVGGSEYYIELDYKIKDSLVSIDIIYEALFE